MNKCLPLLESAIVSFFSSFMWINGAPSGQEAFGWQVLDSFPHFIIIIVSEQNYYITLKEI